MMLIVDFDGICRQEGKIFKCWISFQAVNFSSMTLHALS